jgi:hypothetical protein
LVKAENNSENSKKGSSLFFSRFSRESGKRYNHESGTQEGRGLFSAIFKEQDFLDRLQDKTAPFSSRLEMAGHPFNPRPAFTGLVTE